MNPEENVQSLSLRKHGRQSEQTASLDTEEFDEPRQTGLNLRPLLRTIQRNALLIAGIATVVSVGNLYLNWDTARTYEGDFRMQIEPITSEGRYNDPSVLARAGGGTAQISDVDYPTLLEVLQSPGLLAGIAKQIQVRYPDVSYESLTKGLIVQRLAPDQYNPTKLIEVSYKAEDPAKVQFVLQQVANAYLTYSLEDRKNHIGQGVKFIEDQIPGLQGQVNDIEGKVQALQQRYSLTNPSADGAELVRQAKTLAASRQETQRVLREQKTLYLNLQRQLRLAPGEVMAASSLSQDPTYQNLIAQEKKIESQIAVESARFNEDSPMIQTLREQQRNVSALLNREGQQIAGSTLKDPQATTYQGSLRQSLIGEMVNTANQLQVLEVRDQALSQSQASLKQEVRDFPVILRQYNDLEGRLDIATKTLNQLLIQRATLRVDNAQKEEPWEIVSAPGVPRDINGNPIPVSKNKTKQIIMGVIAGLLLGVGAAVLKEKYRNIFYTSDDIQEGLDLPVLGVIPFEPNIRQILKSSVFVDSIEEAEVEPADASLFVEAFTSLYASIRFLASAPPVSSLVVSSAVPGDGKTTVALHLAQTAAALGQRVLLVDANFRLPELHIKLDVPQAPGLSDLLSKNINPKEIIQQSPLSQKLFTLTSGKPRSESIKMLACTQMKNLMAEFEAAFDLVIYDTPYLGPTDANFLAANTDGILMVVAVGKTERSLVKQVLNRLNAMRLPVLGVVANHATEGRGRSTGYHNPYHEQEYRLGGRRPVAETNSKTSKQSVLAAVQEAEDDR